jgi:hypothetical protein
MDQTVEKFAKALFTRQQVQRIADDHVKFGGAQSSTVSENDTFWIVTTVLSPIAADDDAPAPAASPAAAAVAAGAGAAAGAVAAGPVGAVVGAAVAAGVAVAVGGAKTVNLDASVVPKSRKPVAKQILDSFAAAGFATHHQAAALANAIRESNLNPDAGAETAIERSYGLFQLNTKGGLGVGHAKEELIKPEVNIAIILGAAKKAPNFVHAGSLTTAVAAFVRDIERPANQDDEIKKRLEIATKLFA